MTEPKRTKHPIRPGKGLSALMDAASKPLRLPTTRADFARIADLAESDLKPTKRGRPARGDNGNQTRTRSIRAPLDVWSRLDQLADAKGISVNQIAVLALKSVLAG
jgi:hypothetical protein